MGGDLASNRVLIRDSRFETEIEFKAYLAAQYAAGTPVRVVPLLTEPETISINPIIIPANDGTNTVYTDTGGETTVTGRQRGWQAKLDIEHITDEEIQEWIK